MAVDMTERPPVVLYVWRCRYCFKTLFRGEATGGQIEVYCRDRRCARLQTVRLDAPR